VLSAGWIVVALALWSLGGANFVAFTYVEPLLSHAHALQVVSAFDRFVARAGEPGDFSLLALHQLEPRIEAA
jgi:hypothetical protein